MIVEIQLGTLDRNHTYKILDYYDEYKEKNLGNFIELMVVANTITHERRKRLNALGVNHREIPAEVFISLDSSVGQPHIDMKDVQQNVTPIKKRSEYSGQLIALSSAYNLFSEQGEKFIKALNQVQPPVQVLVNLSNLSNEYRGARLLSFAPSNWIIREKNSSTGQGIGCGSGAGVFYQFYYATNRDRIPFVRLSSSVESPFKKEFSDRFKKEVSEVVNSRPISLPSGCQIWPATKFPDFRFHGTSLLECQPVLLETDTWSKVLQNYMILSKEYNDAIAQLLRKYHANGAFKVDLRRAGEVNP